MKSFGKDCRNVFASLKIDKTKCHLTKRALDPWTNTRVMMVAAKRAARTDSVRVFKQFAWLEVGSVKTALSHPAHLQLTLAIGRLHHYLSPLLCIA